MRDLIFRTVLRVLRLVLPAKGNRRAEPAAEPTFARHVICGAGRPVPADELARTARRTICGTRPVPAHVLARTIRIRGEAVRLVRPYVVAWEERCQVAERRRTAAAAATGTPDWPPYVYPGAPCPVPA